MASMTAAGVAGWGVGSRTRSVVIVPFRVSTSAALTPVPPMSMPMALFSSLMVSSVVAYARSSIHGVLNRLSSLKHAWNTKPVPRRHAACSTYSQVW